MYKHKNKKMKTIKIIVIVLLIVSTITSCKKTKLTGDNSNYIGTWRWYAGWSDNSNTNYKLELKEKGKYKLFNGNDKIDYARLVDKNGKLTFVSDKPFHKGKFASGDHQLSFSSKDTIGIGNDNIWDFPSSGYVRQ